MSKLHRHEVFGEDTGYRWCLHCERTYKNKQFREEKTKGAYGMTKTFQMCPYEDCNGDTVVDSWSWDVIRTEHPQYPKAPTYNVSYPLYPKS